MDFIDYRNAQVKRVTDWDIGEQKQRVERIQRENLALLSCDPTWNVYCEKLKESCQLFQRTVESLERTLLDVRKPLTYDEYNRFQPQLAYARGYLAAVETALDLVLNSKSSIGNQETQTVHFKGG